VTLEALAGDDWTHPNWRKATDLYRAARHLAEEHAEDRRLLQAVMQGETEAALRRKKMQKELSWKLGSLDRQASRRARRELAASKIQGIWKGFSARNDFRIAVDKYRVASTIQKLWRGHVVRKEVKEYRYPRMYATIQIQSTMRGRIAANKLRKAISATNLIRAYYHNHKMKKVLKELYDERDKASRPINKMIRGWLGRKTYHEIKRAKTVAVILMQKNTRRLLSRRKVARMKWRQTMIALYVRRFRDKLFRLTNMHEKQQHRYARMIQNWWRTLKATARTKKLRFELHTRAILIINRVARGFIYRKRVSALILNEDAPKQNLLGRRYSKIQYHKGAVKDEHRFHVGGGNWNVRPRLVRICPTPKTTAAWIYPHPSAVHLQTVFRVIAQVQSFRVALPFHRRVAALVRDKGMHLLEVARANIAATKKIQGWWRSQMTAFRFREAIRKAMILETQRKLGYCAFRFVLRLLVRFKTRRAHLQQSAKLAKCECAELHRLYACVGPEPILWTGIPRKYKYWHPWDAKWYLGDVLSRHRVVVRLIFLKYSFLGQKDCKKAFRMNEIQFMRIIEHCGFGLTERPASMQRRSSSTMSIADLAVKDAGEESCPESGLPSWEKISSLFKDVASWSDQGENRFANEEFVAELKKDPLKLGLSLCGFLECLVKLSLMQYSQDKMRDPPMVEPAECLERLILETLTPLSQGSGTGPDDVTVSPILPLEGKKCGAKKCFAYEEDRAKCMESFAVFDMRLKSLFNKNINTRYSGTSILQTKKIIKDGSMDGDDATTQEKTTAIDFCLNTKRRMDNKRGPEMPIFKFIEVVLKGRLIDESLTFTKAIELFAYANHERLSAFLDGNIPSKGGSIPWEDMVNHMGLLSVTFETFKEACVACAFVLHKAETDKLMLKKKTVHPLSKKLNAVLLQLVDPDGK